MTMGDKRLTIIETKKWLQQCIDSHANVVFHAATKMVEVTDAFNNCSQVILPLLYPPFSPAAEEIAQEWIASRPPKAFIILIQAGYAALGYCEGDTLVHHKMIKKYMVRQSQGKSQLTYKKSKGKSRLGSRIRLQNSIAFFEDINHTLHNWNVANHCESILMSLPVNLVKLLYSAKIPPPFDKKDARIRKIPLNIHTPSYKELRHIHWELTHSKLHQRIMPPK